MDEQNDQAQDRGQWDQGTGPEMDGASSAAEDGGRPRAAAGREMLVQLQQMIDTLATQAAPVMREVAAKAAELAAVAGEKAGPIAHKAAGVTELVGQRVAARSKEMAADLRRSREGSAAETDAAPDMDANTREEEPAAQTDEPTSSDWSA